ncbi:MAG: hypothetical protein RR065_03490 [Clostridia bacterium]
METKRNCYRSECDWKSKIEEAKLVCYTSNRRVANETHGGVSKGG